jgi:hypothetical protein
MSFPLTALRISAGVIVWTLHFAAIYGVTGLACARGWTSIIAPSIGAATALAAAACIAIIVAGWRRRAEFESWLSASVGALALVAIVYEAIPVLIVPICD